MSETPLEHYCTAAIRKGSLSFDFASRLLPRRSRAAVHMLYAWCRHADDVVDRGGDAQTVAELRRLTRRAMAGIPEGGREFEALTWLSRNYALPETYLQELLSGMQMDVDGARYPDLASLRLYCWRVAGTVGVMFSHIVGVSTPVALAHAAELGIAMQMTNIARDVLEDHAMGRCYLPESWLAQAGLSRETAFAPEHREKLHEVVTRLLAEADRSYALGDRGVGFLPLGTALAVAVARRVYSEIGRLVRERGGGAWDRRAFVPLSRKLQLFLFAALQALSTRRLVRFRACELAAAHYRFEGGLTP